MDAFRQFICNGVDAQMNIGRRRMVKNPSDNNATYYPFTSTIDGAGANSAQMLESSRNDNNNNKRARGC